MEGPPGSGERARPVSGSEVRTPAPDLQALCKCGLAVNVNLLGQDAQYSNIRGGQKQEGEFHRKTFYAQTVNLGSLLKPIYIYLIKIKYKTENYAYTYMCASMYICDFYVQYVYNFNFIFNFYFACIF